MNKDISMKSYTIADLLKLFIKQIWVIIICTVLFGVASFCVSKFIISPKYSSYATMYVKSNTQIQHSDGVNLNDLNASKSLASTYIAMLKSNSIMQVVADGLVERYGIERLSEIFVVVDGKLNVNSVTECFAMATVEETELLKITAVTTDAEISMAACEILAEVAPDFLIRVVGAGGVEIVDEAEINDTIVSPNVILNALIGALAGFLISVLVVLLIDFFDNRIKESADIEEKTSKPVIGEISSIGERKKKDKNSTQKEIDHSARTLLDDKIPFYIKEAYKALRANFVFSMAATKKNVVAISSANPGEGKSTTTANIALSLAQTGKKILLIDADMRKPVQHLTFKLKNKKGLSDVLANIRKIEEVVQKSHIENLYVLTSGPKPPNPSELLSSESFGEMMDKLSKEYDYVIIDTPPVNVVSDAMTISDYIAGIVLVIRHNFTRYEDMNRAIKQIQLADSDILGFVLNDIERKQRGGYYKSYYYKKYGKGYGYGYGKHGYGYGNGYGYGGYDYGYGEEPEEEKKADKK